MVDTVRTLAALQALLADNSDQDISAQDVRDFLVSVYPPQYSGASVTRGSSQTITTETVTPVQFTDEVFDTDGYADLGSNNTRLTAPATSLYTVMAQVWWEGDTTATPNELLLWLRVNDTAAVIGSDRKFYTGGATTVNPPAQSVSATALLTAGDYVEAQVLQGGGPGGDRDLLFNANVLNRMTIVRHGQTPV